MKSCVGCKYAQWHVTAANRLHPSGDGKCGYPYKIPPLPAAMFWNRPPTLFGGYINRREELQDHCTYFAK